MFETVRESEMKIGRLLSEDVAMWPFVTIPLFMEWFVVKRSCLNDGLCMADTVLLQGVRSLLEAMQSYGSAFKIDAIHLVSPGWMNETGEWRMDKLTEIWECEDRSDMSSYIFVLEDGNYLPASSGNDDRQRKRVLQC